MPLFSHHASLIPLFALFTIQIPLVAAAIQPFQGWYPEWDFIFDRIIHENCSSEYDLALRGSVSRSEWYDSLRWLGTGTKSAHIVPLINCILEHSSEYIKSSMAAATVVLGLAPSILASLGSSVDETSMLSVIGRRPFLALCLSAGSPTTVPLPFFQYRRLSAVLDDPRGRVKLLFFSFPVEVLILVIEHVAALAAIANVATLGYELNSKVALVFSAETTYLVLLWIFLGMIPHIFAAMALKLRVRIQVTKTESLQSRVKAWIAPWRAEQTVTILLLPETFLITCISGFISLLTAAHLILGTLVFSSMLFISVRDSIPVIGRFLASVLLCRTILMYELARLRHLCHRSDKYQLVEQSDSEDGTMNLG